MRKPEKERVLEELGGIPENIYDKLVREFAESCRNNAAAAAEQISGGNLVEAAKTVHSIRGGALNLRIGDIGRLATSAEKKIQKNADREGVALLLKKIAQAAEKLKKTC